MSRLETQQVQFGVVYLDGVVRAYYWDSGTAKQVAKSLNDKAKNLRVPQTARVVKRHVTTVKTTTPWERA